MLIKKTNKDFKVFEEYGEGRKLVFAAKKTKTGKNLIVQIPGENCYLFEEEVEEFMNWFMRK